MLRSFSFQHENYESVEIDNQNDLVKLPDSHIEFTRYRVSADLNDSIKILCTLDNLELIGTHCEKHSKMSTTKLWFSATDDMILSHDDGFLSRFTLDRFGKHQLDKEFAPVPQWQDIKKCPCGIPRVLPSRNFVLKEGWNGNKYTRYHVYLYFNYILFKATKFIQRTQSIEF